MAKYPMMKQGRALLDGGHWRWGEKGEQCCCCFDLARWCNRVNDPLSGTLTGTLPSTATVTISLGGGNVEQCRPYTRTSSSAPNRTYRTSVASIARTVTLGSDDESVEFNGIVGWVKRVPVGLVLAYYEGQNCTGNLVQNFGPRNESPGMYEMLYDQLEIVVYQTGTAYGNPGHNFWTIFVRPTKFSRIGPEGPEWAYASSHQWPVQSDEGTVFSQSGSFCYGQRITALHSHTTTSYGTINVQISFGCDDTEEI